MTDLTWWCIFIHLTTRPSTDGKRAPLTAISLQAVGSPKEAPPTYIAKMWQLKKLGKNVIFSQNHTETNSYDWTITKKTTRTIKHENFSKMKILKVDRWALSLTPGFNARRDGYHLSLRIWCALYCSAFSVGLADPCLRSGGYATWTVCNENRCVFFVQQSSSTHRPLVPLIYISESGQHWFR